MADEPQNKMDEALRGYARKRREEAGAPLEMHPATRRLLQGEVARLRRQLGNTPSGGGWFRFLPRLGFALSICIVLAVVVWSLRPPAPSYEMTAAGQLEEGTIVYDEREVDTADKAQRAESEKEALKESFPEQGAGKPAPTGVAMNKQARYRDINESEVKDLAEVLPPAQQPVPSAPRSAPARAFNQTTAPIQTRPSEGQALTFAQASGVKKDGDLGVVILHESLGSSEFSKALNGMVSASNATPFYRFEPGKTASRGAVDVATPSWTSADRPEEKPVVSGLPSDGPGPSNREMAFLTDVSQAAPGAAGGATVKREHFERTGGSAVLQNFHVEQMGKEVRIVDADGSVYRGVVNGQPESQGAAAAAVAQQERTLEARRASRVQPGARALSFRATGTNRTLNQLVVLDGVVGEEADAALVSSVGTLRTEPGRGPAAQRAVEATPRHATNQAVRFRGKLRVGGSDEVPIEAVRVVR